MRSDEERDALLIQTARALCPYLEGAPNQLLTLEWWNAVEDLHGASAHTFLVRDSEFNYVTAAHDEEVIAHTLDEMLVFPTVGVVGTAPCGVGSVLDA